MADARPGFSVQATTKLFEAILGGNAPEALRLLDNGADPNGTLGDIRNSALMEAANEHQNEVVAALLKKQANPNFRRRNGDTPLMMTVFAQNKTAAKMIIEAGGNIHQQNDAGCDSVGYAKALGHPGMAVFMVKAAQEHLRQNISDIVRGGTKVPLRVIPFKVKGPAYAVQ
jgi:ankyrin repeat protein